MYTDPIADLLTRIRNASRAQKDLVVLPHSKNKTDILEQLKAKGFIKSFQVNGDLKKDIEITLNPEKTDIELKRVSKPGQRIYIKSKDIKKVRGGIGIAILSTPKGVMTGEEAKKQNLGGELICEVF